MDGLAFKPPVRPGARRKSGANTLSTNSNSNSNSGPESPTIHKQRSKSSLGFNHESSNNPSSSSSTDHRMLKSSNTSPSSSDSSDDDDVAMPDDSNMSGNNLYSYNGAPSSSAAQTVAASKQCNQKLQSLLLDNQERVHAAGRLGQELLNQKRKIEDLREELEEVLSNQESNLNHNNDNNNNGDNTTDSLEESKLRIQELREKIDGEVQLMESNTSRLLLELGANSNHLPNQSIPMSPSKEKTNQFSFLSKDPSSGGGTPSRSTFNPIGSSSSSSIPGQPTPRQSDRRARNNAARQSEGDQEFREEVHKGLLNEVRRISALLVERDAEIALLRQRNDESEKEIGIWKPKALALIESEGEFDFWRGERKEGEGGWSREEHWRLGVLESAC